jgi:hypothetical protein
MISERTFEEFCLKYPLYPRGAILSFQIIRDLQLKGEVTKIDLLDGERYQYEGYLIVCTTKSTNIARVMIPWSIDADVDLLW